MFSVSVVSCHNCCQVLFAIPLVYRWSLVIVVNFSFFSPIYRPYLYLVELTNKFVLSFDLFFSSFPLAESPPCDLQITAFK